MQAINNRYFLIRNEDLVKDREGKPMIFFRNFGGDPDEKNRNGCIGNFHISLKPEVAEFIEDYYKDKTSYALNVKHSITKKGDEYASIKCLVRWDVHPPEITTENASTHDRSRETEETIRTLNKAEIVSADIMLDPSQNNGAYVHQALFVINDYDLLQIIDNEHNAR